jgi:hypothetical protein
MTKLQIALLGGALLGACSHTETIPEPRKEEPHKQEARKEEPRKQEPRKEEPRAETARTGPTNPETGEAPKKATGDTPVARNPATLIVPGQVKRIQGKLRDRGLLAAAPSGTLDGATRSALKRLQHDEDLPETGLPDHETVRKLGLDPDEVFTKRK